MSRWAIASRSNAMTTVQDFLATIPQQERLARETTDGSIPAHQLCCSLSGRPSDAALRSAIQKVLERHDVFRLRFPSPDADRLIMADSIVPFSWHRRRLTGASRDELLSAISPEADSTVTDMADGALLHVWRATTDTDVDLLLLAAPAMLLDITSLLLLAREVNATLAGDNLGPSRSFLHYATWQQDIVNNADSDEDVPYWPTLQEEDRGVDLAPGGESAVGTHDIAWHEVPIAGETWDALACLAHRHGLITRSILLACWSTLLSRLRRLSRWTIVHGLDGRSFEELDGCIGQLSKRLPIQVSRIAGLDLVAASQKAELAIGLAEAWQDGFDVRDWPSPRRDGQPQTFGYAFFDASISSQESDCLRVWRPAGYDWVDDTNLNVFWNGSQATGSLFLSYRTTVRSADTVARIASCLGSIMTKWAAAPAHTGNAIPLTTMAATTTETAIPSGPSLIDCFEQQVLRTPDGIAVRVNSQAISYRVLDAISDSLASRLGARSGETVAVYLPQSLHLVATLLAVHKAGAAFLSLDTQQPATYSRRLVEDAGVNTVITTDALGRILDHPAATRIVVDDRALQPSQSAGRLSRQPIASIQPAYVLYTSGSTGDPKGVVVSHGALANYAAWAAAYYHLDDPAGALVHTSPSVDLTVTSLLAPLGVGGTLVLIEDEVAGGALEYLRNGGCCGLLKLTPSHLETLRQTLDVAQVRRQVGHLVVGGEQLTRPLVEPWLGEGGPAVFNEYGPTEATVACSVHAVATRTGDPVPIGRPICGAGMWLCDEALQRVPDGFVGEIAIGGPGLAEGYLGKPRVTAECFRPHEGSSRLGSRAYRTGDLAYTQETGDVVFIGRDDHQVKIAGVRVELGQVEALARSHPGVAQAAAGLVEEGGRTFLAAWIVPRSTDRLPNDLHGFLAAQLPRAMVPSLLVPLPAMPLTPSGKLDRRALPGLAATRRARRRPYRAPETPSEKTLVGIWERVLNTETIGIDDDFFGLGGHSILAVNMLFHVREVFGKELPLNTVFENSTVAGLARCIDAAGLATATTPEPAPVLTHDPTGRHDPFPMTEVQQAYWIGQTDAYALGNVGAHAYQEVEFTGLDADRLQWAFSQLILRHDMLRMVTLPDGTQRVQPSVPGYVIEIHDLRGYSSTEQEKFVAELRHALSHQVFDVNTWPLFAVCGCRIEDDRIRLHLSFDALLADAWSFEVLLADFTHLYTNPTLPLEPLEITFRDYVTVMISSRDSAAYNRSRDYWLSRADTIPGAPELPLKINLDSLDAPRFGRHLHRIPAADWDRIKQRGAREGLTPSAIVLTAFGMVLSRWSVSPRFTIVLTVFDRPPLHPQITQLVGDFTSLILLEFGPFDGTFLDGAKAVQRQLVDALDHRYFGGVQLLRELARRRADRTPPPMPVVFTSTLTHARKDDANFLAAQQVDAMGINQTPQVYLDHQVTEIDGELRFNWDAVEEVFEDSTLDAMFDTYSRLLDSLTADGWDRVPDLQPPELDSIYKQLNATAAPLPTGTAIERFMSHAVRHGANLAVQEGDHQLSYADLARISSRVGRRLAAAGVGADGPVAVLLDQGWKQVASVLGAHLAGAPYLPIDPELPPRRIVEILNDAGITYLLTSRRHADAIADQTAAPCFLWDEDSLTDEPGLMTPRARPKDLAYVIYTSGSTGKPKGVMIEHRSLLNRMDDIGRRLDISNDDRAIAITALHHDLSVFDIFGLLIAGGAVVMPGPQAARNPAAWWPLIRDASVTLWNSVPTFLDMALSDSSVAPAAETPTLRAVLLSGDRVSPDLLARAKAAFPQTQLYSLGGPTEVTVWDIWNPVDDPSVYTAMVPYGRPLSNARYYVVDEALNLKPVGVAGELCSAGVGLARGYLNDREKTARSFVSLPATGERIYRSGDLGRLRPTGELEILGRLDTQVKVHGQRIELGEVEQVLRQHDQIRDVAATVSRSDSDVSMLVAWIVPEAAAQGESTSPLDPATAEDDGAAGEGMITDPIARIEFKMLERGIRRFGDNARHALPKPDLTDDYVASVMMRRSDRQFQDTPPTLNALGELLTALMQVRPQSFALPKYRYPSAGNAYPIQTYLLVRPDSVEGLRGGAYYYDPQSNDIVELDPSGSWPDSMHPPNNQPVSRQASFTLFLIVDYDAMRPLYGDKARDFSLLEAGYMGQLLMTEAPKLGLGLCPIGTLEFERVRDRFALGPGHELLHAFFGGRRIDLPPGDLVSDHSKVAADADDKHDALIDAVRAFAAERLPPGLVPGHIVTIPALPMTSTGKLDRTALAQLDIDAPAKSVDFVEPETELERVLAGLWSQILQTEKVGLQDDFFQLGGDSILAIQLLNRLQDAFGLKLSLREMLEATTVARLAHLIEQQIAEDVGSHNRGAGQ